jgi:hypothetical protein
MGIFAFVLIENNNSSIPFSLKVDLEILCIIKNKNAFRM